MKIKEKIEKMPKVKKLAIKILSSSKRPKPRFITRCFINPFFHKKGKGSIIFRKNSRLDLFPWYRFDIGHNSIIEEQCIINNGAGDVLIGDNTLIGIGCIITGPVKIGSGILFGQRVFVSGFNHGYKDIHTPLNEQALDKRETEIGDDTFIGTNVSIVPGVHIGKRCQIGAGSVVTKDIPDYCVAAGNPARIIRKYYE